MLQLIPITCMILRDGELASFDCGHKHINEYFIYEATNKDSSNTAKTFVLRNEKDIVGFYTLTVGSFDVENVETQTLHKRPYVNLAYFAIDKEYQRKGYGSLLMQEVFRSVSVISYYTGSEIIYLESVDDSVRFYESLGFQLVNLKARPENYEISTDDIAFPMYISIETLLEQDCIGYVRNFESINIIE
nr:MAG TPA: acetyltransferase domain containing protein [Caudoviricetes sp.]